MMKNNTFKDKRICLKGGMYGKKKILRIKFELFGEEFNGEKMGFPIRLMMMWKI